MAAPQIESNRLTIVEGQTITLGTDDIDASAPGIPPSDILFRVEGVLAGVFLLNGIEATEFSLDNILSGAVEFSHDLSNNAPSYTLTASVGSDVSAPSAPEVSFTPTNDTPAFSRNDLSIQEGETIILNANPEALNLVATDEESSAAELTYTIVSVSNGEFQQVFGGTPLGVGNTFTQAEVDAGAIQFVHDGSETTPTYNLQVVDNGLPDDPSPEGVSRTVITTFESINDTPVLTANAPDLMEGQTILLTSADLSATDVEDNDADLLFTITTVSNGRFERLDEFGNVVEVLASPETAPITFSQNEIFLGQVQFVNDPATDTVPTYSVEVSDLSDPVGTTSSGVLAFNFTAINDPPVLETLSLIIADGEQVNLTSSNLSVVDEETLPENLQYTVNSVANGRFVLLADGSTVTSFTQADINAGNVIAFEQDGTIAAPAFELAVSDGETLITVTSDNDQGVVFQPINNAPVIELSTLTVGEGERVVLSNVANLRTTDEETPPTQLLYTVTIINADSDQPDGFEISGQLLTGPEVTFTQAQVDAGLVTFVQGGSNIAPNLTVTVTDTFNATFGEPITLPVDFQVNFTADNDVPVVVSNTLSIGEGAAVILNSDPNALNLVTTDEESTAADLTYTIDAVANGVFQRFDPLLGIVTETLAEGSTFTQADVDAGTIRFEHDSSELAPSYDLTVTDTAVSPGVPNSVPTTVEIPDGGFITVSDPPVLSVNTLTLSEGQTVTLTVNDLSASDPDSPLSQLRFEVSNISGGTFFLDGVALADGSTFSLSNIAFGEITFEDDGDEEAPSYTVTVFDPEGSSSLATDAIVNFTTVNDVPTLEANAFTIREGELLRLNDPLNGGVVNLSAQDDTTPASALSYTISNVVAGEFFDFLAQPISSFTQQQLEDGDIFFRHDGSENPPSFDITVTDLNNESVTAPAVITFIPVDDAPALVINPLTITEGAALTLTTSDFSVTDPDTPSASLTFQVSALAGGQFNLVVGDTITENVLSFSLAQVAAGQVQFVDDGDEIAPSFSLSISDGTSTTDPVPVPIANFVNTNDLPIAENDSEDGFVTDQNTVLTTPSVLLNDSDTDPGDAISVIRINGEDVATGAVAIASGALVSFVGDGSFSYDPNGQFDSLAAGEPLIDTFEYTISDLAGGTDTALVAIQITGINDGPTLATNALSLFSGSTVLFSSTNLQAIDPDTADSELIFTVSDVSNGEFQLSGSATTSFSQQDISAGLVSFVHDGSETAPSYSVSVSDGSLSTEPSTVTIGEFIPINFAEVGGGLFDLEQSLRFQSPEAAATVPADEIDGLPLAQLFDEDFYLNQNPDIAAAVDAGVFVSGYHHFVEFGIAEGRNPSLLYNEGFYLANNPDVANAVATGVISSGLDHFLNSGHEEGRDPSSLFDQSDYLTNNSDVAMAVGSGTVQSAFEHYIEFGVDENRLPALSLYNEAFYLENNPDVVAAVQNEVVADGFEHYVLFGQSEGRNPSSLFNESTYLAANLDVQTAVNDGVFASGFDHYTSFGRFEGRPGAV